MRSSFLTLRRHVFFPHQWFPIHRFRQGVVRRPLAAFCCLLLKRAAANGSAGPGAPRLRARTSVRSSMREGREETGVLSVRGPVAALGRTAVRSAAWRARLSCGGPCPFRPAPRPAWRDGECPTELMSISNANACPASTRSTRKHRRPTGCLACLHRVRDPPVESNQPLLPPKPARRSLLNRK